MLTKAKINTKTCLMNNWQGLKPLNLTKNDQTQKTF